MTQEQIKRGRIAIAERCGWKYWHDDHETMLLRPDEHWPSLPHWKKRGFVSGDGRPQIPLIDASGLPNYHGSLAAMHEAEKVLTSKECVQYGDILRNKYGEGNEPAAYWHWHATAPQRFEAMLRVLGAHPEDAR